MANGYGCGGLVVSMTKRSWVRFLQHRNAFQGNLLLKNVFSISAQYQYKLYCYSRVLGPKKYRHFFHQCIFSTPAELPRVGEEGLKKQSCCNFKGPSILFLVFVFSQKLVFELKTGCREARNKTLLQIASN